MAWLLLLCHAAALAAFWWLPGWAARRDAALFNANPTSDDFHRTFHRQRLLERAGLFAGLALLANVCIIWQNVHTLSLCVYAVNVCGLLCAAGGIWAYRFNPLLSKARNLPYVDEYYLSPDPRAAWFPDRLLTRLGWKLKPFLTACLLAGIVLYLLALAAGFMLHRH